MNFYVGALRFLPRFRELGLACLAFNRRGHDILSTRASRAPEGGAFQLAREGIEDNRVAARWMAERGFAHPVIIGHSNGGMLACVTSPIIRGRRRWCCSRRNLGGKNIMERTSKAGLMAQDRVEEFTARAKSSSRPGRGRELC